MRQRVNLAEARARLGELVERAARGDEIIIARNGKPRARLVALATQPRRVSGSGKGQWTAGPDFNALPADVLKRFEGGCE